ncbi:MAG: alpha/beta fold hydrolase [Bacteroidia bacterium]
MQRIIFLHGFGEDKTIFEKIAPQLEGEHLFPDLWALLGDVPRPELNVLFFAQQLVNEYLITKNDVIIGHSMGGWIAYHIKHLVGCRIVQIASWIHFDRVIQAIKNESLRTWLVKNHLFFTNIARYYIVRKFYKDKPSKEVFVYAFNRLKKGNPENVLNQLRVILNPVNETITVLPDLRIHSKSDSIIRAPREPYTEVKGDHFNLWAYPEEVYPLIVKLLNS